MIFSGVTRVYVSARLEKPSTRVKMSVSSLVFGTARVCPRVHRSTYARVSTYACRRLMYVYIVHMYM